MENKTLKQRGFGASLKDFCKKKSANILPKDFWNLPLQKK